MADYGSQQGPGYGGQYGAGQAHQRDNAFAEVFGGPRPNPRSQTMTSQSYQPMPADRAQTMSGQRPPPVRHYQPGAARGPPPPNAHYAPSAQRSPPGAPPRGPLPAPPPLNTSFPQQQQRFYPPRQESRGGPAYYQPPRPAPPGGPALNTDNFRSQSLASQPRPQFHAGPAGSYNIAPSISPAHTFRQQPYMNSGPRSTAQGRIVPERPDERTMSMSSYARDHDHNQTMSGRVIPSRQRMSNDSNATAVLDSPASPSSAISATPSSATVTGKQRSASQSSLPSRTMSMASTVVTPTERMDSMRPNGLQKTESQRVAVTSRRQPLVYPALLSKVAECFRSRINLDELSKDGLNYKNSFTGEDAVTLIAYIIKTTDRNLALLLGRSLDAQKFFHDVTYQHRLRDTKNEVYQFKETMTDSASELSASNEVNGVFTLLTECYSPTCTRDRLCYSIACPRRLEQQARLNMKARPVLQQDDAALHDDQLDDTERKLWIQTVPKNIAESIDDREKKRQEVLSEVFYTERDFVKDLEYLRDHWMKPLRNPMTSPIPESRRERFVRTVFSNAPEVYQVNSRLAEDLTRRQQAHHVCRNIGDIFLEHVPRFRPFITYGASQMYAKFEFENEKRTNPTFARFVEDTERLKESRKLELNGYLTKPTTRLARYPLLLEGVLKYTADDNPDKSDLPKAIALIKEFLKQVNEASGKAENRFNLMQLSRELQFRPGEYVDLKLTDESRQLIFKSTLKKAPGDQVADIQAYLFDHAVLLVRSKTVSKREQLKVYRRPIPLELLVIAEMHEIIPKPGMIKRPSSGLMATRTQTMTSVTSKDAKQQGYPVTFRHLGKGGYELTLFCSSAIQQQKWMENVDKQQNELRQRSNVFSKDNLSEGFFNAATRVNCCVPIDGGRKLVVGTDAGVYVCDRKPKDASIKPRRALEIKGVTQIDVLEQHSILLVLTDKTLYSYPLEALSPDAGQPGISKRGRKITHANFFKSGICQGQQLVCCVKTSALSSTIRVYEPMDSMTKKSKKSGLAKMLAGNEDVLKPFKEFYIPTESSSIHFLRSKLCVGCARGFEIVSLETLEAQSLLDQADTSLDFVQRKGEGSVKPVFIERIQTEFLLCYSDYSFFVNRNGWRARPDWMITWEGTPNAFAIFTPYILAFEPSFIEIRHMDTGMLVHIITAKNIRMLHSSTREILYAYEDEMGEDVVASLDFWSKPEGQAQPGTQRPMNGPSSPPQLPQIDLNGIFEQWPAFHVKHGADGEPHEWHVHWRSGTHKFLVDAMDVEVVEMRDATAKPIQDEEDSGEGYVRVISQSSTAVPPSARGSIFKVPLDTHQDLVDRTTAHLLRAQSHSYHPATSADVLCPISINARHTRAGTTLNASVLGRSVSIMDRGRPVRKSSGACWPGVGRELGTKPAEEWKREKEGRFSVADMQHFR